MILPVLAGALVIIGAPGWAMGLGRRVHPAHWARLAVATQLIGVAVLESGLVLWSTPTLLDLVGAADFAALCRRTLGGLVPDFQVGGALAGPAALAIALAAGRGAWRVLTVERSFRVEPWLGWHLPREGHQLVVLPGASLVAYTVGGRSPQIVVSEGLVEALHPNGLPAVLAHEEAHLRRRHARYLRALGAIESALAWYPPARKGTRAVRLALERWADEEAARVAPGGRDGLRRTLLAVAATLATPKAAAFAAAETIVERVRALTHPAPQAPRIGVAAGYLMVGLGGIVASAGLVWGTRIAVLAVANPGMCLL